MTGVEWERQRERGREGRERTEAGCTGHVSGPREDLGFYPKEVGALEDCGQRRDRTLIRLKNKKKIFFSMFVYF